MGFSGVASLKVILFLLWNRDIDSLFLTIHLVCCLDDPRPETN
jgi:hypothetical protein